MDTKAQKAQRAKDLGHQAEDAVLSAFLTRGYRLVARNFLVHQWGELDLILVKDMCLYIVEVKSRLESDRYGGTSEAITKQKLRRMTRVAQVFLLDRTWANYDVRFAAGCVTHGTDGLIRKINIHAI